MSQFIFTVCQVGAEDALKKEIAREHPELKFAYSRPGFVTFKHPDGGLKPDFEIRSVFARAFGLSIGKAKTAAEILTLAETVESGKPLHLHVFERERYEPDAFPKDYLPGIWAKSLFSELQNAPVFKLDELQYGDLVFDVVIVEEKEFWVGMHTHTSSHSPYSGGNPQLTLPENAPSRAYLKFEEAVLWSKAPLEKGDCIVELGCAPGGACLSMLDRGMRVIGIDAADMDASVLRHPSRNFIHVKSSFDTTDLSRLPKDINWIAVDMNTKPEISLASTERLAVNAENLLGVIITLKLNDWMTAEFIPVYLSRIRRMGMVRIRATQLPSNRREICVVALTRLGVARIKNQ